MLTLLSEARFWTARDDIIIKDTDFGAFRYKNKKEVTANAANDEYAIGKQSYAERRGQTYQLNNKGPTKLRNCIKRLEDYLKFHQIVYCQWRDTAVIQMLLSNGLVIHICVNIFTGDILRMAFDKYLVGKLLPEAIITDAIMTRMHILIAYNHNQLTFVYLQKPNMKRNAPEKISRMDPKVFNVIINGPQNRTISRHLAGNASFDLVVVWTKSSQNEVYPWRPTVRDQDRANVHIYKVGRAKLESICYYWTENDPINIEFSRTNQNQLHSVEQKISRKGEVTIEICIYEINKSKLQRMAVTSIPLQTQVCCHSFSPDNEKLILGCIDGSVVIFDESRGITHLVKAAFIPTMVSWHSDSALVLVANERCQFQCFDISLACIKNQLISEDMTPSNLLDLSGYFQSQPNLLRINWSRKPDLAMHTEAFTQTDGFLLMLFEGGPVGCLRFFGDVGLKGDVHTSGLTADVLIHKYLNLNNIEKAINVLLCLNWDTYGAMCLIALHRIANWIFRSPLTVDREVQLQKALGSFHVPVKKLCDETEQEFGDQVRDITRKYFQYLLRYKSYEKAFSLAIDINDEDLFMDLHNCARSDGDLDLAADAYKKAAEITLRSDSRGSLHSFCSHSSCSECGESTENSDTESRKSSEHASGNATSVKRNQSESSNNALPGGNFNNHPPLPVFNQKKNSRNHWSTQLDNPHKSYVPPLPFFSNNALSSSPMKLKIPKPDLKPATFAKNPSSQNSGSSMTKNRYYTGSAFQPANIRLVDPPLPISTIKKTSSQDNILHNFSSRAGQIYQQHNSSFSTDGLNNMGGAASNLKVTKMPRTQLLKKSQQHMVIDVVPKPMSQQLHSTTTDWTVPDQTLGIPLTFSHNLSSYQTYVTAAPPLFHNRATVASTSSFMPKTLLKSQSMYNITGTTSSPVVHQHPMMLAHIPPSGQNNNHFTIKKSSGTISNTSSRVKDNISMITTSPSITSSILSGQQTVSLKKESGERNKVKFSDTVTVAVVPEIPRKEKPPNDRLKRGNGYNSRLTDPQRELAESLPLCHPNDDYLKDFAPMSDHRNDEDNNSPNLSSSSTIKVVHFGVV